MNKGIVGIIVISSRLFRMGSGILTAPNLNFWLRTRFAILIINVDWVHIVFLCVMRFPAFFRRRVNHCKDFSFLTFCVDCYNKLITYTRFAGYKPKGALFWRSLNSLVLPYVINSLNSLVLPNNVSPQYLHFLQPLHPYFQESTFIRAATFEKQAAKTRREYDNTHSGYWFTFYCRPIYIYIHYLKVFRLA